MECIFCKIAAHTVPATIVYEDEKIIAFDDINPKAPVHVLLIYKDHNNPGPMLEAVSKVARKKGIDKTGYRLIVNVGPHAGQEVEHLHMHLLGGKPLGPMLS